MVKSGNMQLFQVRIASINDTDKLVLLVNRAYRGETGRRGWTTEADLIGGQRIDAEMVRGLITEPENSILIVEEERADGRVVAGCVHVRKEAAEGSARCHFGLLTVDVDQQRRGLGDFILGEAEAFAYERCHARTMRMYVISIRRPLIEWYQRRGYQATGERAPFPYGEERFGIPLRDDLEFIVMEKPLKPLRDRASIAL